MNKRERSLALATPPSGTWVQTDRQAHEKWAALTMLHPRSAAVLHVLIANMGRSNAILSSQSNLARLAKCSVRTLQRALDVLRDQNWLEVRQVGPTGTVNAYIINDRVAWSGNRDGIRYSMFSASVLISDDEQPDREKIDAQEPLIQIPELFPGEQQLPSGEGLPPPSEPQLPGLVSDLPAKRKAVG